MARHAREYDGLSRDREASRSDSSGSALLKQTERLPLQSLIQQP
jgi:hypothetical protein